MTTFTTTITSMRIMPQLDGQTDVVVNAQFLVSGVDGDITAEIGGNQQFTITPDDTNFTPYANLTQAQVIGWIDLQTITNLQACVQGQIDSIKNPPVSPQVAPLPWAAA